MKVTGEDMKELLDRHARWLKGQASGRRLDLWDTDLAGISLVNADLRDANLGRARLQGADLSGADLRTAYLEEGDLRRVNLRGADLRETNFSEANLEGADLRQADLRRAIFWHARLVGCMVHGANFQRVDLRLQDLKGVIGLVEANLEKTALTGADLRGTDLAEFHTSNPRRCHLLIKSKYYDECDLEYAVLQDNEITAREKRAAFKARHRS